MSKEEVQVVFTPSGKRGSFPVGTPVLVAARRLGVDIDSVCGGNGLCGRCQIVPTLGQHAKHNISSNKDSLTGWTSTEETVRELLGMKEGRRLSCSVKLTGDIVIDVPEESQVHKQVVRKGVEKRDIKIVPTIRLHHVLVEEPDMHDPTGDFERLQIALKEQAELPNIQDMDLPALRNLQKALRKGNWNVTVAVHQETTIMAIWPGLHDAVYGIAVDLGSTTIAAHLCNLATGDVWATDGVMNPQIRFGEDLMSRVSYNMMNPGGDVEMTQVVREAINDLVARLAETAEVDLSTILNMTFVGNPVMVHLLLGLDPTELGGAPFALAIGSGQNLSAAELELSNLPINARVYVLPCIAGHVGADAAAVVLSEAPYRSKETILICDVGTNAEIVLGNRHKLLAASSPTGPAFEGAQISCGQRAAPGAIERIRIDPETLEPRFKVIGCDLWSDEKNFSTLTTHTGVTGICGSAIIEIIAEMYLNGILTTDGVIDGSMAKKSTRIRENGRTFTYVIRDGDISDNSGRNVTISITQNDVRAIQLAKAALYAGAQLLMDKMGITKVDKITLAGAFGSHIDVKYAMAIGLIPDCDLKHVRSAGNAAGTGALIALLDATARTEIQDIVHSIEKVETAVESKFQDYFVDAMAFPHKHHPYPNLDKVLPLPAPKYVVSTERKRRRR